MGTDLDVTDLFERMPFNDHLGIELREIEPGHAVGKLDLSG